MARQVPEEELEAIVRAVAGAGTTVSIDEIAAALQTDMPRRALQRRVALLLEQLRLVKEGRARAVRYRVPDSTGGAADAAGVEHAGSGDEAEDRLPVSPEGAAIRQRIQRPIRERQPVGHNREFLDRYGPSHEFYLSESLRNRLAEWGVRRARCSRRVGMRLRPQARAFDLRRTGTWRTHPLFGRPSVGWHGLWRAIGIMKELDYVPNSAETGSRLVRHG